MHALVRAVLHALLLLAGLALADAQIPAVELEATGSQGGEHVLPVLSGSEKYNHGLHASITLHNTHNPRTGERCLVCANPTEGADQPSMKAEKDRQDEHCFTLNTT